MKANSPAVYGSVRWGVAVLLLSIKMNSVEAESVCADLHRHHEV